MAAEQAKDRGNRAFAAGKFADAVACFSEALALHDKDPSAGKAHVYYSNRSAAQLKRGNASDALQDADRCVALQSDWPKGYSRRGAALYALGRYPDAFRAYKDGLAHDAANSALLEGLHSVELKLSAPRSGSSSASSSAPATGMSTTSKSLRGFLLGDKRALFQLYQFVLRSLLVMSFVCYWLPVVVPAALAYTSFFKLALLNHASYLAFTHGVPKWQAAYAQRLLLDPATQALFFCLVFWVSTPHGLALVPVFLLEMVHWSAYASSLLETLGLSRSPVVSLLVSKVLEPLTAKLLSDPSWPSLPARAKWAKLYTRMPQVAANLEVALGVALLLELLTPARNFLLLVLYWQVLRVRYMISPQLQEAFRQLHASLLLLVNHPRCPAPVAAGYTKLHAFAVKMSDPGQQQQAGAAGAGGLASRCNVM